MQDKSEREPKVDEAVSSTPGGLTPEAVEDRPSVGSVKPEDYPPDDRAKGGI